MSEIWVTADLHFGHKKILHYQPDRPGTNIDEMNEAIISAYNERVGRHDNVYIIGDLSLTKDRKMVRKCFYALRGNKHLFRGNHDPNWVAQMPGWGSVREMGFIHSGNAKFFLCHYPMLTWNGAHRGVYHLHGHCHGMLDPAYSNPARMDVGIDTHSQFAPYHIDEVLSILKEYVPVDQYR